MLKVRNVGFRGFAIETVDSVAPRTRARFHFSAGDCLLFDATAVAVHCHRSLDRRGHWISGWEFPEQLGLDEAVERLTDNVLSALSFD